MIVNNLESKRAALELALDLMGRGHNSLTVEADGDGEWTVFTHGSEIFPDYPEWSYDDGVNLTSDEKTGRDVTQLFDPYESLSTVEQFAYYLSNVSEWLENTRTDAPTLDWSPVSAVVEDWNDETQEYLIDGEWTDDNIVGHVYGAILYPYD